MSTGRLTHHPSHVVAPHVPSQPDTKEHPPEPPSWLSRATQPPPISPESSLPQVSLNLLASLMSEQVLAMRRIEAVLDQFARSVMRLPERKPNVVHPLRFDPDTWPRQP